MGGMGGCDVGHRTCAKLRRNVNVVVECGTAYTFRGGPEDARGSRGWEDGLHGRFRNLFVLQWVV